jgi:hypothetical protein
MTFGTISSLCDSRKRCSNHAKNDSIPLLTREVALSLIDDRLTAAGSTRGVTRDEINAAFT